MIENAVTGNLNGLSPQGFFSSLLSTFINILFILATIFFFFNLVMGGIAWTSSAGDKGKLETAKQKVLNSVIGIFVVFSTYVLVNLIAGIFQIDLLNFDINSLRLDN